MDRQPLPLKKPKERFIITENETDKQNMTKWMLNGERLKTNQDRNPKNGWYSLREGNLTKCKKMNFEWQKTNWKKTKRVPNSSKET